MLIHAEQNIRECFNVSPQSGGVDVLMKRQRAHTHRAVQGWLRGANEQSVLCQTLLSKTTARGVSHNHTSTHTHTQWRTPKKGKSCVIRDVTLCKGVFIILLSQEKRCVCVQGGSRCGGSLAADRKCCIDVFFVGSQF